MREPSNYPPGVTGTEPEIVGESDQPGRLLEIVNPSDPYTISGDDEEAACLAALLLGSGKYGLADEQGEQVMPIFLLGGCKEWVREKYGKDVEEWASGFPRDRLAAALESVVIGSFRARREADRLLAYITDPDKRAAWLAERHDDRRSSMNDIGGRAVRMAARCRSAADPAA